MKRQQVIRFGLNPTVKPVINDPHKPDPRPTQTGAFHALKDAKCAILNAPTGWGKTLVIALLVLWKLSRNPELRCVIATSQTIIGGGFIRDWQLKVPGIRKLFDWVIQHDLCKDHNGKAQELIQFLGSRAMRGRVLLCTHATLAGAYAQLKKERQLSKLNNVLLWIDEAHHVMNAQAKDDTVSNSLGEIVRRIAGNKSSHVGLATATFMRGDRRHIIPDHLTEKFTRHDIPYDVYFNEQPPVEGFTFDVMCGNYLDGIAQVCRKKCPTIIYLPKRNSQHATDCKYSELKQIINRLAKVYKVRPKRKDGLILLGDVKVLDLVTPAGRKERQAHLQDADIIIALDMCKEGFDWPKAARSIIIGERHSVPEMIQMIGRLFRQVPGKKLAEVYQILPAAVRNTEEFQDARNDILTVIFSAMLLEDVFAPVALSQRGTPLAALVTNTDGWQRLVRDYHATLADAAKNGKITWKASLPFRKSLLNKHGILEKKHKEVWEKLWATFARLTRRLKGHNVKDVPFRLLKNADISEGLLKLSSGLCGKTTFAELRVLLSTRLTATQHLAIAEHLTAKNGGICPSNNWLRANGYTSLIRCMIRHKATFAHIKRHTKCVRRPDILQVANDLIKQHGGLPTNQWLRQNGFHYIKTALYDPTTRAAFADILSKRIRIRGRSAAEKHHRSAQMLVKRHGMLPPLKWLRKHGFARLAHILYDRQYTNEFAIYPRRPRGRPKAA